MAEPFVSLPPALALAGGHEGLPAPTLCALGPLLCVARAGTPARGSCGVMGANVAEDNGHQAWPVTQFPPDLGVTKEVFIHLGVTPITQKHLLDTPPPKW